MCFMASLVNRENGRTNRVAATHVSELLMLRWMLRGENEVLALVVTAVLKAYPVGAGLDL